MSGAIEHIPVASCGPSEPDLLIGEDGGPVWPLRSALDRAVLLRTATLCGGGLSSPAAAPGVASKGGEIVVGLHREAWDAALLYAHLTGRSVDLLAAPSQFRPNDAVAVVVADCRVIDQQLLASLYEDRSADIRVPGIVCGTGKEEIRRRALSAAAAARLSGPFSARIVDLVPTSPFGVVALGGRTLVGRRAPPEAILEVLQLGLGVLAVVAHSDGIDADFGSLIVCALRGPGAVPAGDRDSPTCVTRAHCHRLDQPLESALASPRLISPSAIAAKVVLLHVCYGLMLASGRSPPSWGLVSRMLAAGTAGAVVASWGSMFAGAAELLPLTTTVASGVPVGDALAAFTRTPACSSGRTRLCLLGDPLVRLPTSGAGHRLATPFDNPPPLPRPRPENQARSFITTLLSSSREQDDGSRAGVLGRASAAVEAFETRSLAGEPVAFTTGPAGELAREAALAAVTAFGTTPSRQWLLVSGPPQAQEGERVVCFVCGSRSIVYHVDMGCADLERRRLTSCPCCGVIEDSHATAGPLALRVADFPRLRLSGPLPRSSWSAGVLIEPGKPHPNSWFDWPADDDGAPVLSHEVRYDLLPGTSVVAFYLMERMSLRISRAPVRR